MIIEQVDALKLWLTSKLSPICDAEPSALAKYVCALVKKDKQEQELRDICVDQLDVFLQQNTRPFVDELFEVLKTKVYISVAPEPKPRPPVVIPVIKQENKNPSHLGGQEREKDDGQKKKMSEQISSTTDDKENKEMTAGGVTTASSTIAPSTVISSREVGGGDYISRAGNKDPPREVREHRTPTRDGRDKEREEEASRDRRDTWKDDRNRDSVKDARDIIRDRERDRTDTKLDTREVREPRDRDFRERDRDYRRRRTRSRSYSPRRREFEFDRRRRFEERPRYSPERRWGRRRSWSRSPRRNRSPIDRMERAVVRPRSRSPRLRSRSPRERYRPFRSRSRTPILRSPRPRSWSRPGSGPRLRTRSPSNTRLPDSRGSTPLQDNNYISSSTNDLPTVTSIVGYRPLAEDRPDSHLPVPYEAPPTSFNTGSRGHCQNFEEKGFCMLGDVCPYDHGTDPVVVEDMSLPGVIPGAATTGIVSTTGFIPPDMRLPPPSHMGVRINLQRPPPPQHVEPYLPEAPSLHKPPLMRVPPLDLRQPPPGMVPNRAPQQQDPFYLTRREVIINRPPPQAQEPDLLETIDAEKEPLRIVLPSKRPYSVFSADAGPLDLPPRPPGLIHVGPPTHLFEPILPQQMFVPQIQPPPRRSFDYSRLGVRGRIPIPRPQFRPGNLTLEVRKIPHEFNNISKLNEHFGRFGNLTNIQVKFQGDPGAALITFSNSAEANAAYRSPEPVFNNRFIKLFWHNSEKQINLDGETESPAVVGEEDRDAQAQPATMTGGRVGDGIDHPSLLLPVRPSIPPSHKLQLDNTKAKAGTSLTPGTPPAISEALVVGASPLEKSIVYTSSVGNLKKTVFNSAVSAANAAALAKAKTLAPFVSPTTLKSADHVSRMEAISRAEEERKLAAVKQVELEQKKQELLAKQIQQQKILLDTLEKKKATMNEEEKKELWKALRTISDSIDKIKYGTGAARKQPPAAAPAPTFPTSSSAQFRYISGHEQQPFSYGRGRAWSARAPGWREPRGRAHLMQSRTHLDNRPKTIEVKGFDLSELEEIKHHFQTYGVIDKVDLVEEVPSMFLTYATRPSAEMAVSLGGKFKKKTLIVRWNQMTPKITRTESTQSSEVDEDLAITLGSLSEQSLSDFDSEDKAETASSALFTIGTPNVQEKESQLLEETTTESEPDKATQPPKPALEDLFVAGEEHFKASYSDEEDDEDHITVTLSNTSSAPLKFSSEDGFGSSSNLMAGQEVGGSEVIEDDHGNFDSAALDYNDDGPWI